MYNLNSSRIRLLIDCIFVILVSSSLVAHAAAETSTKSPNCKSPQFACMTPAYSLLFEDTLAPGGPSCPADDESQQCGVCEVLSPVANCGLGVCTFSPEQALPSQQQNVFNCRTELCSGTFIADDADISPEDAVCHTCDAGDLLDKPDGTITSIDPCLFCDSGQSARVVNQLNGPELVCPTESYQYSVDVNLRNAVVSWSGSTDVNGVLTVGAAVSDGTQFSIVSNIFQCQASKTVASSDGRPGSASETAACFRDPISCLSIGNLSSEAESWANNNPERFGGGTGGGCADAARHAYFNAIGVIEVGDSAIRNFSDAHEFSNFNSCNDNNMDLINNRIGRTLGAQCRTRSCAQQAVTDAIKSGLLTVWSGNAREVGSLVKSTICKVSI